jgi:hypothetical protein
MRPTVDEVECVLAAAERRCITHVSDDLCQNSVQQNRKDCYVVSWTEEDGSCDSIRCEFKSTAFEMVEILRGGIKSIKGE